EHHRELGHRRTLIRGVGGVAACGGWNAVTRAAAQDFPVIELNAFDTALTTASRNTASNAITTIAVIIVIMTQPGTSPRSDSSGPAPASGRSAGGPSLNTVIRVVVSHASSIVRVR